MITGTGLSGTLKAIVSMMYKSHLQVFMKVGLSIKKRKETG